MTTGLHWNAQGGNVTPCQTIITNENSSKSFHWPVGEMAGIWEKDCRRLLWRHRSSPWRSGGHIVLPGGPRPRHSPSRLRSECSVLSTPVLTPVTLITPACCHVTSRTASEGLPGKQRCLFRPDTRSRGREVKARLCLPWVTPRPSGPAPRKSGANLSPTPAPPHTRAPRAGTTSRFHSKRP